METQGNVCNRCGSSYSFDLMVSNKIWSKIRPEGSIEGGGMLCPNCITKAVKKLGWSAGFMIDVDDVNPNAAYPQ